MSPCSSASSFSTWLTSDLMDCPVAAPIVIAIKVKGLKLSGALRAVIAEMFSDR